MIKDVAFTSAPAGDIVVLDLWDGQPPLDARLLAVEPGRWWLIDGGDVTTLAEQIAGRGALTPIGGGFVRLTVTGPGWRELLTVSGWFDTEGPDFTVGSFAATMIHHVPVRIIVASETECDVYVSASYASTITDLWDSATGSEQRSNA